MIAGRIANVAGSNCICMCSCFEIGEFFQEDQAVCNIFKENRTVNVCTNVKEL